MPIDIEDPELMSYVIAWKRSFEEGRGPIVLQDRGKPMVAIISIVDLELLKPILREGNEHVVEAAVAAAQMQIAGIEYLEEDDKAIAAINGLQL